MSKVKKTELFLLISNQLEGADEHFKKKIVIDCLSIVSVAAHMFFILIWIKGQKRVVKVRRIFRMEEQVTL